MTLQHTTSDPFTRLTPLQWLARKPGSLVLGVYCFWRQLALVAWESAAVVGFMKVLTHGLLGPEHPWVTGLQEGSDEPIWSHNIAYRSTPHLKGVESDEVILARVGRFLSKMVARSASGKPEAPHGPKRRMPHAVNYLHGGVHYNGLFMIFDDIPDLMAHIKDPVFRRQMLRLGRTQRREITLILRTRRVDPLDYAYAIGCLRGVLPWFSNGNGPTGKPVLWGNAAPYPVINLIHGAWMRDMWTLWRKGQHAVCRPALDPAARIPTMVPMGRRYTTWSDRLWAWFMFMDVRARGFRGQLVFTNRPRIEPQRVLEYRQQGGYGRWVGCHEVPHPFQARVVSSTEDQGDASVSIIIPTLQEEARIGSCIRAIRAQWPHAQLIVADAHSTDHTAKIAREMGAQVVLCDKSGRGSQCRQGAHNATGDVLVFLHADCVIGEGAAGAVMSFAKGLGHVAKFTLTYDNTGVLYRVFNALAPQDHYFANTGDHGIVIRREFYDVIGQMPDMPLFEDVELFWRAWLHGARLRVLSAPLHVSSRRFDAYGPITQITKDARLMVRYALGTSAWSLARRYGKAPRLVDS